jgi:2-(1,2-epoxy-1,2-dihydrophenyl)acetyl-CoA isomerase
VSDEQPVNRYEALNVYRKGAALTIELNRPDRMNPWSPAISRDLITVLAEAKADDGVRAVVITGAGRAFCSGADLKDGPEQALTGEFDTESVLRDGYHPIVIAIRELEKPVITAVNGPAAGAGVSLALAGDIVVAAESAFFLLAFTRIGLVPDGGSSLFVTSRVGFARAAEMALLAEPVPAAKAVDWGLINRAWPDAEFPAKVDALAQKLANGPTRAFAGAKRELNNWLYGQLASQLNLEADIQGELTKSADFIEGVSAFLEKRQAKFSGS